MKKNNIIDEWIEKAEGDYETVIDLKKKKKKNQQYIIAFHCQQCIEKYLKAVLTFYNIAFPKHHDLEELLVLLLDRDPFLSVLRNSLKTLTPFAVTFRYPGEDVSLKEMQTAVVNMKKVRQVLKRRLQHDL